MPSAGASAQKSSSHGSSDQKASLQTATVKPSNHSPGDTNQPSKPPAATSFADLAKESPAHHRIKDITKELPSSPSFKSYREPTPRKLPNNPVRQEEDLSSLQRSNGHQAEESDEDNVIIIEDDEPGKIPDKTRHEEKSAGIGADLSSTKTLSNPLDSVSSDHTSQKTDKVDSASKTSQPSSSSSSSGDRPPVVPGAPQSASSQSSQQKSTQLTAHSQPAKPVATDAAVVPAATKNAAHPSTQPRQIVRVMEMKDAVPSAQLGQNVEVSAFMLLDNTLAVFYLNFSQNLSEPPIFRRFGQVTNTIPIWWQIFLPVRSMILPVWDGWLCRTLPCYAHFRWEI